MALVVAPRFFTRLIQPDGLPLGKDTWKDTVIVIPYEESGRRYRNIFTGETVTTMRHNESTVLCVSEILAHFPVALMERIV